jgi:hypothetical protein
MATGDQHGVCADLEGLDDQIEIDAPRAWQANDAHIRWIFQARGSGKIGSQVGAPIANVRNDLRLECGRLAHAMLSTIA